VVAKAIRNNPAFKGPTGEFDRFQYDGVLRNSGLTAAYFEFQTRQDMVRSQLQGAVSAASVAPKTMTEALYRYRQEKRVAEIAVILNASIRGIPTANDTDLSKFHADNKARYTASEYRSLTWIVLAPEDVADDIAVSDEDIELEYDDRLDEFVTPESRSIDQLLYATDNEAGAVAAARKLSQGSDFKTVAAQNDNLQGANTSLGAMVKSNLPEEAQDSVFALAEGGVSAPIKTLFGWHIFRVAKIEAGSTKSLADTRAELKKSIQLRRAAETLYKLSADLEDELAGGATLYDAAARFGLKVQAAPKVDGAGLDDKAIKVALPAISDFLITAFETEVGVEPALKESRDGSYFLVQVNDIIPPTLKPFNSVRQQVTTDWRDKQRDEAAARKAAELAETLKGGGNFAALAKAAGLKVATTEAMTRFSSGREKEVSSRMLTSLFKAAIGGAWVSPTPTSNGHVVGRLKSIERANPGADVAALKKLSIQLADGLAGDLLAQYQMALQDEYEVTVHRQVLESLF
jgi:peptidyl-prolyl cis-trans isomerase D